MIFSIDDDSTDTDHVFAVMNFLYWDILIILNAKTLLEETDVKKQKSRKNCSYSWKEVKTVYLH